MRSDNGSEFTAKRIHKWLKDAGSITAYIEPGSPWENGYIESFNSRMRAEFLNGELFDTMFEAQVLTQRWIRYYNQIRPHSSLGGRPNLIVDRQRLRRTAWIESNLERRRILPAVGIPIADLDDLLARERAKE